MNKQESIKKVISQVQKGISIKFADRVFEIKVSMFNGSFKVERRDPYFEWYPSNIQDLTLLLNEFPEVQNVQQTII